MEESILATYPQGLLVFLAILFIVLLAGVLCLEGAQRDQHMLLKCLWERVNENDDRLWKEINKLKERSKYYSSLLNK
jgi:hypothetical protein